ncbi:MAG: transcriptional regulator PpsR [Paracoccaceae bacterium]
MTRRGARFLDGGAIPLIAPGVLGDIIASLADVALVVDEAGTVLSVLPGPEDGDLRRIAGIEGRDLRDTLTPESVPKLDARLAEFLEAGEARPLEVNHAIGGWGAPVRYALHSLGGAGAILMVGRDLRPVADMQQRLVDAQLALEADHEERREASVRHRVALEHAPEALIFVALSDGRILDANARAAALAGRETLTGAALDEVARSGDGPALAAVARAARSETPGPVPLSLGRGARQMRALPVPFRAGAARLAMLRLTEGPAPAAERDLSDRLLSLYRAGTDAIVFTDAAGTVLSSNDAFHDLAEVAHGTAIRGRSLADFLGRGSVDLNVMTDNAARTGRMRLYATRLAGEYGAPRPVEISVAALDAGEARAFAFVLREPAREAARTAPAAGGEAEGGVGPVMELVGTAPLRDIVAQTTEVVERMCIETAVELTNNNRVAAAEMLGLSRQSLYVKLRKYDLLSRGGAED